MAPNKCCNLKNNKNKGFWAGLLFGLFPHSFCLAFIFFSIIGAAATAAFFKKFMLEPNLFLYLTIVSLIMATISAIIYFKKKKYLLLAGIKNNWRYLVGLYATTILANLLMFLIIFPALASLYGATPKINTTSSTLSINVQIPCSGHSPLIIDEIKKNCEVQSVTFSLPNKFTIKYDAEKTTPEKIAALMIFKKYPLQINNLTNN